VEGAFKTWISFLLFIVASNFKLFGSKTIIFSVGIGFSHLWSKLDKIMVKFATYFTDISSVRDKMPHIFLKSLGMKKRVHVVADPVFLLYPRIHNIIKGTYEAMKKRV